MMVTDNVMVEGTDSGDNIGEGACALTEDLESRDRDVESQEGIDGKEVVMERWRNDFRDGMSLLVMVKRCGTYIHCGNGSVSGGYLRSCSDLVQHLSANSCQARDGIKLRRGDSRKVLGRFFRYEVIDYGIMFKVSKNGREQERFPFPACLGHEFWSHRFQHCVDVFPKHGRKIGEY